MSREWPTDEVLADVARTVGSQVMVKGQFSSGSNGGAMRVNLASTPAVLKSVPRTHAAQLDETLRAKRLVDRLRDHGYPTPAWLAVGATPTRVWTLTDWVDASPAAALTSSLVEQLIEIIELQAGLGGDEPYDHWSYAWSVATGRVDAHPTQTAEQAFLHRSIAALPEHSADVAALIGRIRRACAAVPRPTSGPDIVHADLATPSNVLTRDGRVVAVVDIGNAGSGTRAIDLTTLLWYCLDSAQLDDVRRRLGTRIRELVGPDAVTLLSSHVLHMLELAVREGRDDAVVELVGRGHRVLDELSQGS